MSRATNIYIVAEANYDGDEIEAAFTVKHECKSYLKRTTPAKARVIHRLPDGGRSGNALRMSEEAFLAS